MKPKNKNYQKVDRQIIESFITIAVQKSASEMTVSEVCKYANINHTTFYRHFKGLWEVRDRVLDFTYALVANILRSFDFQTLIKDPGIFFKQLNKVILDDLPLFQKLSHAIKIDVFLVELHAKLVEGIIERNNFPTDMVNKTNEILTINFLVSGSIAIYRRWLQGEIDCSIDEVGQECTQFIEQRTIYKKGVEK